MQEKEQKALRTYCAFLLTEYGFHFSPDDPVIPALFAIHKEVEGLTQSNHELALVVKEASSNISPVTYQFNCEGEAWKFQMGIAIKWVSSGLLFTLFAVLGIWYWSVKAEIDNVRIMNQTFETAVELNKLVKKQDGFYFMDFTAAKGDSAAYFTEFIKLDPKTVRVYLGRKRKQ